jgi:hypothetical protein
MKKLIITILVMIFCINFTAAAETPDYDALIEHAQGMKMAGMTMTIIGIGCYVGFVGVYCALVARLFYDVGSYYSSSDLYYYYSDYTPYFIGMYSLIFVGAIMEGVGIPCWIVGGIKKLKYTRRKNALSSNELNATGTVAIRPIFDVSPVNGKAVSLGLQFSF